MDRALIALALLGLALGALAPAALPGARGASSGVSVPGPAADRLAPAIASLAAGAPPFSGSPAACVPGSGPVGSDRCALGPAPAGAAPPIGPTWSKIAPTHSPSPRVDAALVYDASDGYVILFGGDNASAVPPICELGCSTAFSETWKFANGSWEILDTGNPPARVGESLAYDAHDGYVVLFGGEEWCDQPNGSCPIVGDTWIFHGGRWQSLSVAGPPARLDAALAYDPALPALVLFGGVLGNGTQANDTWSFTGGAWSELTARGPPADLYAQAMTFDGADGYLLLLDPPTDSGSGLGSPESWGFADGAWSPIPTNNSPPPLFGAWLSFDPAVGYVVLVGESLPQGATLGTNVTWGYWGGNWFPIETPNPPLRVGLSSLAYDAANGALYGFGGEEWANGSQSTRLVNDTWSFAPPPLAIELSASVSPAGICAQTDPGCPAGTNQSRVTLSLETVYAPGEGVDVPLDSPTVEAPTFSYVPYGNVVLAGNLSAIAPVVRCSDPEGYTALCDPTTTLTREPNGAMGLSWRWSQNPWRDEMLVRAKWSASFSVTVTQPPYGAAVVDACTTSDCVADASGAVGGNFTRIDFSPFANATRSAVSFGPALLTVEGPAAPPPNQSTPPPPPAPRLSPPPPELPVLPVGTSPTVSAPPPSLFFPAVSPIAAGIIAAGMTRIAVRRRVSLSVAALAGPATPTRRKGRGKTRGAPASRFE